MNAVFITVLTMSVGGAVLTAAVFSIERLLRGKVRWTWMYYIWLLVAARLLVPFGPVLHNGLLPDTTVSFAEAEEESVQAASDISDSESAGGGVRETALAETQAAPAAEAVNIVLSNIWVVWLGGALILLVRKVTAAQSFTKYVRAGSTLCGDAALLDRVQHLSEKTGIARPIELAENPLVASPMILGISHPCIVLPRLDLPSEEFDMIVLHELVHCRRLDQVYKWIVQICVCIHWFNPLVHLMAAEVNRTGELACDQAVLQRMGPEAVPAYGKALVHAMAGAGAYNEDAGTVELSANKKALKERLLAMKKQNSTTGKKAAAAVALSVLLMILTACSPVYLPVSRRSRLAAARALPVQTQDTGAHIEIFAENVDLTVRETRMGNTRADYGPGTDTVSIVDDEDENRTTVTIIGGNGYSEVTLYVRDLSLRDVILEGTDSSITWNDVPETEIQADLQSCSALLAFPDDYSGNAAVTAIDSYVVLSAPDALSQADLDVSGADLFETDEGYTKKGGSYRHSGAGDGRITIDAPGSLVHLGGVPADGSDPELEDFSQSRTGRSRGGLPSIGHIGDDIRGAISEALRETANSIGAWDPGSSISSADGVSGMAGLGAGIANLVQEILQGPVRNFLDSLAASI